MAADLDVSDIKLMTKSFRARTIAVLAICYPLATIAVLLRFLSRRISKNSFWWDDWLAATGLSLNYRWHTTYYFLGIPHDDILDGRRKIDTALMIYNTKGAYVAELFYYLNQLSLKLSILCFYWRVFSPSNYMRRSIQVIGCFIILWFIASFIVAILQCVPIEAAWDPVVKAKPGVKCVDLNGFFFGTSVPNIVADLVLVLLPVQQVWQLNITVTQKVFIIFFFLLGGFVVITSIVRLRLLILVDFITFPINWTMDDSVVWTIVENCCGVVSVCLASLRPIIKLLPWANIQSAFGRSSGRSNGSNSATRTKTSVFSRARHPSQWSQIDSSHEGMSQSLEARKHTTADVVSIEMQPTENSSQHELAGPLGRYG
ncbi:unnamed protein product [Clonostachys chloroleuca]|uniref:Rhodopsin domain-containing protein n=1 Tax=Clonostachys chloroleuca TaxID=1926264 RepID=A0AA35PY61_9HYPO|nr:unnamed protein product [Clonostachys chloroleuca]